MITISLRCADPDIFVRGGEGWGGGGPTAEKQPQQRFFKPSTDFTVIHGGSNIFQGGGPTFPGGGGGGEGSRCLFP